MRLDMLENARPGDREAFDVLTLITDRQRASAHLVAHDNAMLGAVVSPPPWAISDAGGRLVGSFRTARSNRPRRRSWPARAAGCVALVSVLGFAGCSGAGSKEAPSPPTAVTSTPAGTIVQRSTTEIRVATDGHGPYLTDDAGIALYTYDNDSTMSRCYAACSATWPPLLANTKPVAAEGIAGRIGLGERTDGSMQVTYNGSWLYRYSGDGAAGDTKGDGVGGVWHLAKP